MRDEVGTSSAYGGLRASSAVAEPRAVRKASSRKWLIVGAAVLASVAAIGVWRGVRGGSLMRYVTAPATRGTVERTVTATGTLNPILTVIVGSYVSGTIVNLSCDYNTLVKVGQVCA
ncbi:MAG TPA: hypothetical protein VEH77_09620 [Roseiarcus sp.]|nr:hypothetical protein [Roseiarcus sp.]